MSGMTSMQGKLQYFKFNVFINNNIVFIEIAAVPKNEGLMRVDQLIRVNIETSF